MSDNPYPIRPQIYGMGEDEDGEEGVAYDEEGGAEDGEQEEQDMEGEEEARKARIPRRPSAPTKEDILQHEITHFPPRDWCQHCVAGHGISNQHRKSKEADEDRLGVTIGMDYCFMNDGEREEGVSPILIMFDDRRKALWVLPCENKGAVDIVVQWACEKLEEAGYSGVPVTLKSDQELAIVALKKAIAIRRRAETPLIESPVRESKSNGSVERSVRTWRAHFLTLKSHLEARLKMKLEGRHPLRQWLASWASETIIKYKIQPNGRTSYEMMTGHKCKHFVVGFAEKVAFKISGLKTGQDKAESLWSEGYFLGVISRTTEYLIATTEGIVKCASIKRLLDGRAYDPACLEEVTKTFFEYIKEGAKSTMKKVRFADETPHENPNRDPIESQRNPAPYGLRLTKDDFKEHGWTGGCKGCEWMEAGEVGYSKRHTQECRTRMSEAIARTAKGAERHEQAERRKDKWVEEVTSKDIEEKDKVDDEPNQEEDLDMSRDAPSSEVASGSARDENIGRGVPMVMAENRPIRRRRTGGSDEEAAIKMRRFEAEREKRKMQDDEERRIARKIAEENAKRKRPEDEGTREEVEAEIGEEGMSDGEQTLDSSGPAT